MWGWISSLHQSYILAPKQPSHKECHFLIVGLMLPEFLQSSTNDMKLTCPSSGQQTESEKMLNRLHDLLPSCCSIKGFPKTSQIHRKFCEHVNVKKPSHFLSPPLSSSILSFKSKDGTESPFSFATKAVRSWAMILSVHKIWRKMLRFLPFFFRCLILRWVNPLPVIPGPW